MDNPKNEIKKKLLARRKYSFCTCGKSDTLPYCDNKHRKFNEKMGTNYKSFKIIPVEDTTIWVSSSTWKNPEK